MFEADENVGWGERSDARHDRCVRENALLCVALLTPRPARDVKNMFSDSEDMDSRLRGNDVVICGSMPWGVIPAKAGIHWDIEALDGFRALSFEMTKQRMLASSFSLRRMS